MSELLGFVILHYNVIKETIDCIQSIEDRIDTENYYIVVVDNHSPNLTGEKLQKMYADHEKIRIILNKENLGFARGNNVGCDYALRQLHCDFICVMNNDTLLIQDNFFDTIQREYEFSGFAVMGPRIILKNGEDNPVYYKCQDLEFLKEELILQKRELWIWQKHLYWFVAVLRLVKNGVRKLVGHPVKSRYRQFLMYEDTDLRKEDVVLHGCCLVFSRKYFAEYENAFHPDTFLYREEEILYTRCKNRGLTVVYNPELLIRHLEDAATDSVVRKKREKRILQLENQIRSIQVLIGVMQEKKEK